MADELNEASPVDKISIQSSVEIKEYTDENGQKVRISTDILESNNLKKADPDVFEKVINLKEPNEMDACRTCRFWKATEFRINSKGEQIGIDGVCRFEPPVIFRMEGDSAFPPVGPYEWCGKFEAIPEKA